MTLARRHWLLNSELPRLREELSRIRAERASTNPRAGGEDVGELYMLDQQEQHALTRMRDHEEQICTYLPAPRPTQTDRAQLGHLVKLKLDEGASPDSPKSMHVLLVGDDEGDPTATPLRISYNAALGRMLVGREVGDFISVKGKNGGDYEIEDISIPELEVAKPQLSLVA